MAVKLVEKKTGEAITGKYASIEGEAVNLFSGIMSDKKGGWRGCGRKQVFPLKDYAVSADKPEQEIKKK